MTKSVLITGCSTGIGRATAQLLTRNGYRVIATARKVETLEGLDVAMRLPLDVTDDASVREAVNQAGGVDIVVNNAGVGMWTPVESVPIAAVERLFQTNVLGALRVTQAFLPGMRARRNGRVIMISSAAATRVSPLLGLYCASKGALEDVARALRFETNSFGIEVVVVSMLSVASEFGRNRHMAEREGSPYSDLIERSTKRIQGNRANPATAEQVGEVIRDAIERESPPFRIYVGENTRAEVERVARMADADYDRMVLDGLYPEKKSGV